jgi:hypothetical protein
MTRTTRPSATGTGAARAVSATRCARDSATTVTGRPEKGARFVSGARVGTSGFPATAAVPQSSRVPGGGPG